MTVQYMLLLFSSAYQHWILSFLPVVHLMSCSEIYMYIFASSIQCFRGWVQNADYTPRMQDVYSARVQHVDVSYLKLRFGTCW